METVISIIICGAIVFIREESIPSPGDIKLFEDGCYNFIHTYQTNKH